jgi:uncharacterized membrane protein
MQKLMASRFPLRGPSPEDEGAVSTETERASRESIEEVAALEEQALRDRSLGERVSDALTGFVGRLGFVVAHLLLLAAWFAINSGLVPGVEPFDPFPFGVLTLVFSSESVLLTLLVLISQNRMARQADLRAHLTLQIGLLAEKEATRTLEIVERLGQRLELAAPDERARTLASPTDLPTLADRLKQRLPGE